MSKPSSIHTKEKIEKLLANTGDMALKRRARRIIEELDPQDGDRILDVGCGDGYYPYLLSNLGINLRLTGTDFDSNALASARKNLKDKRIPLVQADLMKGLPFEDSSFDKVVMSEVCEHLSDDIKGLKEVRRVLKPGGILCLTVPNHNYPIFWDPINWILEHLFNTHVKFGFWAGIWNQHLRLYKPDQVKRAVIRAGFIVEKIEVLTRWSLPFNHFLINLGAIMLAEEKVSNKVRSQVNKFEKAKAKKGGLIKLYFDTSNFIDKFNNNLKINKPAVGIFVKAVK